VTINLRLFPNPPSCCLVGQDAVAQVPAFTPAVEILDLYLVVPRIRVKPSILKKPVIIPYQNYEVLRFSHPAQATNFGPRNLTNPDVMPTKCIVLIWTEAQFNGSLLENRLAFNHHSAASVIVTLNNEPLPIFGGLQAEWADTYNFNQVYEAIFETIGDVDTIDVPKQDFRRGFTVWAFDLSQKNILGMENYPNKRTGSLDLAITFADAPPTNLVVLAILVHERKMEFSARREVNDVPAIQ